MVAKAVSGKMVSLRNMAEECGAMIVVVHAFEKENQVPNGKASVTPDNAVISLLNKNLIFLNFFMIFIKRNQSDTCREEYFIFIRFEPWIKNFRLPDIESDEG